MVNKKRRGLTLGASRSEALWTQVKASWGTDTKVSIPLAQIDVAGVDNGVLNLVGRTYLATMQARESAVNLRHACKAIQPRITWIQVSFPDDILEEEIEDYDDAGKRRRQVVRRRQSPLLNLHTKSPDLFDKRLLAAGERYYADWIKAQISPMGAPDLNRVVRPGWAYAVPEHRVMAVQRLVAAHDALSSLERVRLIELVVAIEKPLREAERLLKMRNGRGRDVLAESLTRLAAHYEGVPF